MMLNLHTDRSVRANSVDPDQIAPEILKEQSDQGLHCHSISIVWMHYSMVKPHSLNFKIITAIFRVPEFSGFLLQMLHT